MTTTDHDILRIEGNIAVPEGDVDKAMAFFNSFIDEIYKHEGYSAALTITDAATSPHVLILKEDLEGLRNRIERQRDAIEYLQEKEVQQGIEFKEITESLQRKQKLLDKAWADYDQVVKELTKERKKIATLEAQNEVLKKNVEGKENWFNRIKKKLGL